MAQSTYLGYVAAPSGKRLVVQAGTHAFATAATSVTLTVNLRRLISSQFSPQQVVSSNKTAMMGVFPYVTSTDMSAPMAGTNVNYRLVVKRNSGGISGFKFAYLLTGY